jgi:NADP-dependent 3-hydroxy acid dehydrogenase YdfG
MTERRRVAWLTGASSGIGAATAVELAGAGFDVAIGARRLERLEEVGKRVEEAGGRAFAHALDVASPASIERFCGAAERALGEVDVLVNNAGRSHVGLIHEVPPEELRTDIEVNLMGAVWMTRHVLPAMLERGRGDVLFVTSENAIRPRPYQAGYSAAKAGLEAFARVLEMETEGSGVRSIIVRVGPTGSEFGNEMAKGPLHDALASWQYWGLQRHLHWMPAESVARAIARTLAVPVEESYPTVVEIMPGGRKKEQGE